MEISDKCQITAIEPQVRHKGRFSVFIDGEFALGLDEVVVASLHLKVGQEITPERLREASHAEERHQATEDAFNLLGFRARSEKELSDRLRQKGYEEDIVVSVIARMKEYGYLDDTAFASSWVSSRGKTRGSRLLAQELRFKGVDKETVRETLSESRNGEEELQAAMVVAIRRVGERPKDSSREAQAKLAAFLQRRGFGWEAIRPVLKHLYHRLEDEDILVETEDDLEITEETET